MKTIAGLTLSEARNVSICEDTLQKLADFLVLQEVILNTPMDFTALILKINVQALRQAGFNTDDALPHSKRSL